jgi:hypothetical protein
VAEIKQKENGILDRVTNLELEQKILDSGKKPELDTNASNTYAKVQQTMIGDLYLTFFEKRRPCR